MRTAVISDIHGNVEALDAVLAEASFEGYDEIVCLGDVAVLGPSPAACVDRLRALGDRLRCVRGNTDRYLLEGRQDAETAWTAARLGPVRLAWLATFATDHVITSADALCVHGSPRSDEERLDPDMPAGVVEEALDGAAQRIVLHGHTHVQYWGVHAARLVGNPGSVGFPCDGEQRAAWAIVEGDSVNLRRTRYSVGDTINALETSDSPVRAGAIARLMTAR